MGHGYERPYTTIIFVRVKFVLHCVMLCERVKGKGINTVCILCYLLQEDLRKHL